MRVTTFICLFIFFPGFNGESLEDSPVFGYHLRLGVPEATKIKWQESLRIVGGSAVSTADSIPYQAGIIARLTSGLASICGGSLVSTTRVLTAAHCWYDGQSQANLFTVVLGSLTIFSGGTRISTTDVTNHPLWRTNMLHDIAVVRIPAVKISNTIQAIPLPTLAQVNLDFVGFTGLVSGYGKTSDAQTSFPKTTSLRQTTVSVITNAVCQKSFKVNIHGSHLCTDGTKGQGTCTGDSGGPLTVVHNNRRVLVGIVSFGAAQGCQAKLPSVFTRVTAFLSWINPQL